VGSNGGPLDRASSSARGELTAPHQRRFTEYPEKSIHLERGLILVGANLPCSGMTRVMFVLEIAVSCLAQLDFLEPKTAVKWADPTQNFEQYGLYPNTISYKDIVISE
jgi:hypothetical protein